MEKVVVDFTTTWKQSTASAPGQIRGACLGALTVIIAGHAARRWRCSPARREQPAGVGVRHVRLQPGRPAARADAAAHVLLAVRPRRREAVRHCAATGAPRCALGSPNAPPAHELRRMVSPGLAGTNGCRSARSWWTWRRSGLKSKSTVPTRRDGAASVSIVQLPSVFYSIELCSAHRPSYSRARPPTNRWYIAAVSGRYRSEVRS